jgi:predicted glycosyltransferase
MARNSIYNILMYSHDTYGLGHIRRTLAIATNLLGPRVNILILTGSPIAGRFSFPDQIDFVRIPGMIKKTNDEYQPLSIKINAKHALDIRRNIITATAKTFQPHLFIVDKEPLGLKKEVLPTLQWLRRCRPDTKAILGLRDIMDDAASVIQDWQEKDVYRILEELYSEIWVYGIQDFYDPIKEYQISDNISRKMLFTGYIPRKVPSQTAIDNIRKENRIEPGDKLVVVTTGGGGDGYTVMHTYLAMLEGAAGALPFKSVLITGPFMPKQERKMVFKRAKRLGVRTYHFYRQMEKIFAAADVVVSMGGYNTLCEILNQGTVSLVIPREIPRKEQLLRAQAFSGHNLVDYIPWGEFTPEQLKKKILTLLDKPEPYQEAMARFRLNGIETMSQRLNEFRCKRL